jgi:hypothetical protein
MSLPQARQQINADLGARAAQHQQAVATAVRSGLLGQPNSPLNLLADGDSWFDYPLGGLLPMVDHTDIIAQLPDVSVRAPLILKLAHYGDATTTELGLTRVQKISDAINNGANGRFDAILFSGGGNDVAGEPFAIWLNDAGAVGNDPTRALNPDRFNAVLGLIRASYEDLIQLRNDLLPGAPIFVHAYDFAIPTGTGACPTIGPWLRPALNYCGWTDMAQMTQIVHDALAQLGALMQQLAADPANNVIYVPTQGTLAAGDWANELHPNPAGFRQMAVKFQAALQARFPDRI